MEVDNQSPWSVGDSAEQSRRDADGTDQSPCDMDGTDQSSWSIGGTDQSPCDVDDTVDVDQSLWEELKRKLCDELTPAELKEALYLMPKGICRDLGPLWTMEDPHDLLIFLENNMPENEAIQILENILSIMQLHGDFGCYKNAKRVDTCRKEVHRLRRESKVYRDEYFVGREDEIKSILDVAMGQTTTKGAWLYGLGGMGKTVLAVEICYRLRYRNTDVDIINVNLKGILTVSEMLRSILTNADRPSSESDANQLQQILLQYIESIKTDTVLLLDNMEDVYIDNVSAVNQLLHTVLQEVETRQHAVKLLITSRIGVQEEAGGSLVKCRVKEVEVGPLRSQAADSLLSNCIKPFQLSPENSQRVLHVCGNCPLAIRLVSNQLRQISPSPDSTFFLPDFAIGDFVNHVKSTGMAGMDECIEYSISRLDKEYQLVCKALTIFETSKFGIQDAKTVLKKDTSYVMFTLMCLRHLCIIESCPAMQRVEISVGRDIENQEKTMDPLYAFHPRVWAYLDKMHLPDYDQVEVKSRFLEAMLHKIEKFLGNYEEDFQNCIRYVNENIVGMKAMFECLGDASVKNKKILSARMCMIMHNSSVIIGIPIERQQTLFRNCSVSLSQNPVQISACLFWKIQEAYSVLEHGSLPETEEILSSIENTVANLETKETDCIAVKAEFYLTKSRLRREQGLICEAMEEINKSVDLFRKCLPEKDYISRVAHALNAKGVIYHKKNDYEKALNYQQEAYDIMLASFHDDRNPEMTLYAYNIANDAFSNGELIRDSDKERAKELYELALTQIKWPMEADVQLHMDVLSSYADKLNMRATILERLERHNDALQDHLEVLQRRRNMFGEYHGKTAMALYYVARVYFRMRDHTTDAVRRRELLVYSLKYYHATEDAICNGAMSYTDHGVFDILKDYTRAATASKKQAEIKHVEDFRLDFQERRNYGNDSSSESSTTDSPENLSDNSDSSDAGNQMHVQETLRRDSGYTDSVSSADFQANRVFPIRPANQGHRLSSDFSRSSGNDVGPFFRRSSATSKSSIDELTSWSDYSFSESGSTSGRHLGVSQQISQDSVFMKSLSADGAQSIFGASFRQQIGSGKELSRDADSKEKNGVGDSESEVAYERGGSASLDTSENITKETTRCYTGRRNPKLCTLRATRTFDKSDGTASGITIPYTRTRNPKLAALRGARTFDESEDDVTSDITKPCTRARNPKLATLCGVRTLDESVNMEEISHEIDPSPQCLIGDNVTGTFDDLDSDIATMDQTDNDLTLHGLSMRDQHSEGALSKTYTGTQRPSKRRLSDSD